MIIEEKCSQIYTRTCPISNWSGEDVVLSAMNELFSDEGCKNVIQMLTDIPEEGVHM